MYENLINQKVLVRSYEAGVYFGTLEEVEGSTMRMSNARNIWYWTGANCLADIAAKGVKGGKISRVIQSIVVLNVCQVMPLTDEAVKNLESQPIWTI